jgi:hypothetical protein
MKSRDDILIANAWNQPLFRIERGDKVVSHGYPSRRRFASKVALRANHHARGTLGGHSQTLLAVSSEHLSRLVTHPFPEGYRR